MLSAADPCAIAEQHGPAQYTCACLDDSQRVAERRGFLARGRVREQEARHPASLSGSATFLQVPFRIDFAGQVWDEPRGLQAPGWGPLDRLYQARDRWLCVTVVADDLPRLAMVSGLEGMAGVPAPRRGDELAVRVSKESATTWVARLTQVGDQRPGGDDGLRTDGG